MYCVYIVVTKHVVYIALQYVRYNCWQPAYVSFI